MSQLADHVRFIRIAKIIAEFSKCQSIKVGCVIVKDKRILSSGCNGTPTGSVNCCDLFESNKMSDPEYRENHHKFSEALECHAEQNAILNAARYGISIEDSIFYVSLKPCEQCLKMIAALNVKYIFYHDEYDKFIEYKSEVTQMIKDKNIIITKI